MYIYNWGLWFLLRISAYIYCRLTDRYVLCIFCVACIALLDLWWRLTSLTLTSYCSNTTEHVNDSELLTHISLCISYVIYLWFYPETNQSHLFQYVSPYTSIFPSWVNSWLNCLAMFLQVTPSYTWGKKHKNLRKIELR